MAAFIQSSLVNYRKKLLEWSFSKDYQQIVNNFSIRRLEQYSNNNLIKSLKQKYQTTLCSLSICL